DEAAARECLEKLAAPQRAGVQAYRADMSPAFHKACRELLPNARPVVDRFHVAKLFNEALDTQQKKNHPGVQGEAQQCGAPGVSLPDVGISPPSAGFDRHGEGAAGGLVPEGASAAEPARIPAAVPEDL